MIRQEERIRASFETRFANLNFDYNQTKRGQKIAANVAKLTLMAATAASN
jgi:hypothetical protein